MYNLAPDDCSLQLYLSQGTQWLYFPANAENSKLWWLQMAEKTLNVLNVEDFPLLVLAVFLELNTLGFFFFSSKADSTADDVSNKLAQVRNTLYSLTIKPQEMVEHNVSAQTPYKSKVESNESS